MYCHSVCGKLCGLATRRAHHEVLSAAVQQAAEECRTLGEGCLITAASALHAAVADLLDRVQCTI